MKSQPVKKQLFPPQEKAKLEDLLNKWVSAVNQLAYWQRELSAAIQNDDLTCQPLVTATFHSNSRWTKTELIALQVDLCARLSSLLTTPGAAQPDQTQRALGHQLNEDTQHLVAWCQQIQSALGLDSTKSA